MHNVNRYDFFIANITKILLLLNCCLIYLWIDSVLAATPALVVVDQLRQPSLSQPLQPSRAPSKGSATGGGKDKKVIDKMFNQAKYERFQKQPQIQSF